MSHIRKFFVQADALEQVQVRIPFGRCCLETYYGSLAIAAAELYRLGLISDRRRMEFLSVPGLLHGRAEVLDLPVHYDLSFLPFQGFELDVPDATPERPRWLRWLTLRAKDVLRASLPHGGADRLTPSEPGQS